MVDSINQPELRTCECLDCQINYGIGKKPIEKPASASRATLGFNSAVIKPEMRVNNKEVAEQILEQANKLEQPKECEHNWLDTINRTEPEQPNLKIIEEIEGLISQVNEKLEKLEAYYGKSNVKNQALEEIGLFQKTTLFELRKAFE